MKNTSARGDRRNPRVNYAKGLKRIAMAGLTAVGLAALTPGCGGGGDDPADEETQDVYRVDRGATSYYPTNVPVFQVNLGGTNTFLNYTDFGNEVDAQNFINSYTTSGSTSDTAGGVTSVTSVTAGTAGGATSITTGSTAGTF